MGSTFSCLFTHIIFSTKHRERLIAPESAERLYAYMGGIIREERCVLLAAGGIPDHVHLLVSLHPTVAVANLLRVLKTNSSSWAHDTLGFAEFGWQDGYGAFSVSKSAVDQVRAYIANQEEHHRRKTFEEEFIEFLDRHGVEYDPKYVFD